MPRTFRYTAIHMPSGKRFEKTCEALNQQIFLAWVNTWNHNSSGWLYLVPIYTNGNDYHPTNIKDAEAVTT